MIEQDENVKFLKGNLKLVNEENDNINDNINLNEENLKPEKELSEKKIKNMPKKQKIIFDIINLSKLMNKDYDEKTLKKMKISELEKVLGGLANNALTGVEEKNIIHVNNKVPIETATNALYNVNFLVIKSIEDISNKLKSPIVLDGLTKNFNDSETDLKNCLSAIINDSEYGDTIKSMLSPITLYCFCMLNIIGKTAAVNMIDPKNGSSGNSTKELPQSE